MVNSDFDVFLCNTVTGKITAYVPVSELSWGQRLNDSGSVSATLPVGAEELRNVDLRLGAQVLSQSLGVVYNGTILECGPIWSQEYDAEAETLKLNASGLWSILNARKALPGTAPGTALAPAVEHAVNPSTATLALRGSLGDIARELVRVAIQDNPFTRPDGLGAGHLNIVLPPVQGGTRTRNYFGYDLGWVGERLADLTGVQNGPDIRFRPRFSPADATVVEWVMEVGTEAAPLLVQDGPDWLWDTAVAESGVVKLGVTRDAASLASRAWVPGNGQEAERQIVWATDPTLAAYGFPWTEIDDSAKDVESPSELQGYADRLLAESGAPWDEWSLEVRADAAPRLGDYLPGDWARINVGPGHPMIEPGVYRVRVMAVDGNDSAAVKLTVAPMQGRL